MRSMLLPFNRYAQCSGRSGRKEYWRFILFTMLVTIACYAVIGVGAAMESSLLSVSGMVVLALFSLACFVPTVTVTVRRLHDSNKPDWLVLLILIPLGALVVLFMMLLPGTPGDNRFGPPDTRA
ncbi:DUF805 domain-containing protein [Stenotrophomonas rhizophila]|uniref:DUF805 domain-containing protein n=1 Tax=Stenotrophomonas rhizophila TaxID=216778 RepID=UPI001E619490|nr:DUF805 domain-containing protein [Stenotrophomonas rhizophila]MCC7635415.1 DUF805 domain-containing protein [Stenotrophomonas rhizophila]MCC7664356.1 DUF805 domain-containing protein [Stenotrophomonas rhizophila]